MVESRVCGGGGSFGCRPASAWRQKQAGGVPRPSAQLLPRSPGRRSAARAPSQAPELPGRHFVAANIGAHDVRLFSQDRNAHFWTRRAGGAAGGPPATTFFPGMPEDGLLVPRPDRAFRLAPKYGEGGKKARGDGSVPPYHLSEIISDPLPSRPLLHLSPPKTPAPRLGPALRRQRLNRTPRAPAPPSA